ncbi:uncharacterized protein LOC144107324 [Amblyomma americanum]
MHSGERSVSCITASAMQEHGQTVSAEAVQEPSYATYSIKAASGLGSTPAMARANVLRFLVQFLGLSSSQLLECSSPRVPYLASVVHSSPDATLLLSGLHTVEPFSATNGQPIDNASRSAQFLHGQGPYLQASWLSLSRLNAGTAPVHPAHAWTCAKKAARSGAPFSGLGSTPAMARANVLRFLVQFLGLSSSQLLECSSPRVPYLESVVNSSPDATLLLSGLHTVEPFSATNGQPIDNASRSAQFLHGQGPYLQASWLSLSRLNTGTAPVHPAHAWTCAKKAARSGAPFSGLGSTPAMARANVLRFLVQVMKPYCLYAKPSSYRALLVLPSPRRFRSIMYDYPPYFTHPLMQNITFHPVGIVKVIESLKNSSSTGVDGINAKSVLHETGMTCPPKLPLSSTH